MRTALCLLLPLAFAISGCLSNSSPRATVDSENATALRVEYAGGADEVVRALTERGCEPDAAGLLECEVRSEDGQAYIATIALSSLSRSQPAQATERTERTGGYMTESAAQERVTATAEGDWVIFGPELDPKRVLSASDMLRRQASPTLVRATARLYTRGERAPVRLSGDSAAQLRETHSGLSW